MPAKHTAAPHSAPITNRAINPGGEVRLGVFGSLSETNSASANSVNKITAGSEPSHVSGEESLSHPRRTAHAVTAGGVSARKPPNTPIKKANASTCVEVIAATNCPAIEFMSTTHFHFSGT